MTLAGEKTSSSTHGAAAPAAIEEDKDQTSVHKVKVKMAPRY